ncbi:hypothetical protein KHA80_19595 [Anaerobacillus sp. HL2]|nr:hypothetical protein KHA80_19595 [Anaerobacillus sp. HL2]
MGVNSSFDDNEQFRIFGDAVLNSAFSIFVCKVCGNNSEDEIMATATIVCRPSLAKFATFLHFGEIVLLGKGEEMTGSRCPYCRCV